MLLNKNQSTPPPPPSSYSEALKRTGDTVASIQRSLCDDQRHNTFEKDCQKAANSFFIPELCTLLSRVDEDLATTGSTRVAKPTSEIVKTDLHCWVMAKAASHINDTLLKSLPPTPSQLFAKIVIRRNEGKPTSAIVECHSRELKNLVCRIIRMKMDGRQTRSNLVAPLTPGASAVEHDYKKAARVSDAKLQFRPLYSKLNASKPVLSHAANLIKTVLQYKSYDVSPLWARQTGKPGKPHLSISLKYEAGPLGPCITLDPDKLISGDTEAVLDYLATQLTLKYPDLTSSATKWNKVRRELAPTIENSFKTYLSQSSRKAKDNNSDANLVTDVDE